MEEKPLIRNYILKALEKSVDGYVRVEDFLYNTHIYARGYERHLKKSNLSKIIKGLREKGYIDTKKHGRNLILKLTDKGKAEAVVNKILENEDWDGVWRIVIFDIPEDMKKVRDIFRSRLKLWGFKPWQKSVWISKKALTSVLRAYIKEVGVGGWVKVVESRNID